MRRVVPTATVTEVVARAGGQLSTVYEVTSEAALGQEPSHHDDVEEALQAGERVEIPGDEECRVRMDTQLHVSQIDDH